MDKKKLLNENLYIPVMALIICLAGVFYVVNYPRRQFIVFSMMILGITAIAFLMIKKGFDKISVLIFAVLLISLLIKADYVIYTPCYVRQHDVIGFGAGFGQAAFIEYFYEKIRLIDFDPRAYWGFFQPPLHHMVAGLWLRLMDVICPNYGWACDNVQLLTLLYSALIPFVSLKIFKKIGLHNNGLIAAVLFVSIHPCFILMAGSINNDVLCLVLQVLAMYFFVLWNEEIEEGNYNLVYIILTAFCMGLTMMAKLSGFLIAPAIGIVMIVRLFELCKPKQKNTKVDKNKLCKLIGQYALFGIISVPIGMWSPVRNLIKFGVPLNFTPEVGEPLTGHSLLDRIFDIRTSTPFTNLVDSGSDYDEFNFFLGMLKTSLVGEYTFADIPFASAAGWLLLLSGAILTVIIFICAVKVIKAKCMKKYLNIFLIVYTVTTLIFYVNLCFSIPNFSSLDFRYIAHLIIIGAVYLGYYVNHNNLAEHTQNTANKPMLVYITYATLFVFSISSAALYLLAGCINWR